MPLSTELEFHPLILVTHRHRAPDEITPACGCPQGLILRCAGGLLEQLCSGARTAGRQGWGWA